MKSMLNIFISWSGDKSREVAEHLSNWLPLVIDGPNYWLSSHDIPDGRRWSSELSKILEKSHFGIIILTPENQISPWLMFESGALSKNLDESLIIPYLVGVQKSELKGPLAQFHALEANREGTLRLITAINDAFKSPATEKIVLQRFDVFWPALDSALSNIFANIKQEGEATHEVAKLEDLDRISKIDDLQWQIMRLTDMVYKLVDTWAPKELVAVDNKKQQVNSKFFNFLEGAWFVPESNSYIYSKQIKGYVHTPYCYGADDFLTGVHYNWQKIGEYWFARFRWFKGNTAGFGLYKCITENELNGRWWQDFHNRDKIPSLRDENTLALARRSLLSRGGVPVRLIRLHEKEIPNWAKSYFSEIEKESVEKVWRRKMVE